MPWQQSRYLSSVTGPTCKQEIKEGHLGAATGLHKPVFCTSGGGEGRGAGQHVHDIATLHPASYHCPPTSVLAAHQCPAHRPLSSRPTTVLAAHPPVYGPPTLQLNLVHLKWGQLSIEVQPQSHPQCLALLCRREQRLLHEHTHTHTTIT